MNDTPQRDEDPNRPATIGQLARLEKLGYTVTQEERGTMTHKQASDKLTELEAKLPKVSAFAEAFADSKEVMAHINSEETYKEMPWDAKVELHRTILNLKERRDESRRAHQAKADSQRQQPRDQRPRRHR